MPLFVYDADNVRPKRISEGVGISLVETDANVSFQLTGTYQTAGTWTPTITQGVGVTGTINLATYRLTGKICTVHVHITILSPGTSGQQIVIGGQPAIIQPANETLAGVSMIFDSGVGFYVGIIRVVGGTDWRFYHHSSSSAMGGSPSFGLVNPDSVAFSGTYAIP
jgi:hypothetical protein